MRLVALIVGVVLAAGILFSGTASAWNPFSGLQCDGAAGNSTVCQEKNNNGDPVSGANGLLLKIANVIAVIAGIAAVFIIMFAGLRMITSNGSSDDVAGARRAIVYTIIGLVVVLLARTIIVLVIGGL